MWSHRSSPSPSTGGPRRPECCGRDYSPGHSCLIAVVTVQQRYAGFPWLRLKLVRTILSLSTVEMLGMALVPALATQGVVVSADWGMTDVVALATMVGFAAILAWQVWSLKPERPDALVRHRSAGDRGSLGQPAG